MKPAGLTVAALMLGCTGSGGGEATAVTDRAATLPPLASATPARLWLVPNQLASEPWYRQGGGWAQPGAPINGHIQESFGHLEYWPQLRQHLVAHGGGLGIYASEIGHLSDATIGAIRSAGVPISVEVPGWTQIQFRGEDVARAELTGARIGATNIFASVFLIVSPTDRPDPDGRGWFVTADGSDFEPEEIILDERVQGARPWFDPWALAQASGSWSRRKASARRVASELYNAGWDTTLSALIEDYRSYARQIRARWPIPPRFALHWNANPWVEEEDEACMDRNAARGEPYTNPAVLAEGRQPCYRTAADLTQIVAALCAEGMCPAAVYLDLSWPSNSAWALEFLRRNRAALAPYGVSIGIDLVDSGCRPGQVMGRIPNAGALGCFPGGGRADNELAFEGQYNILRFLIDSDLYGLHTTALRFSAWSPRPYEIGAQVAEWHTAPPGMAAAANRVLGELIETQLVPPGLFVTDGGVFMSNGSHFCGFDGSESLQEIVGVTQLGGVPRYGSRPAQMVYDGFCSLPATPFVSGSGVYASNGVGHYCWFPDWTTFVAITGRTSVAGLPTYPHIPAGMVADGPCGRAAP
jgi:hypothetical protein